MDSLSKAAKYANEQLVKWGLAQQGWRFEWDNSLRRFGVCRFRSKTIGLSRPLTLRNSEAGVFDTILHEVAHALCPPREGHGPIWRAKAILVGAKPIRCCGEEVVRAYRYTIVCRDCGEVLGGARKLPARSSKMVHRDCPKVERGALKQALHYVDLRFEVTGEQDESP